MRVRVSAEARARNESWDGWECGDEHKGKDEGMDKGEGKDVDDDKHEGWDGRTG